MKLDLSQTSLMLMVTLGCNSQCAHCCFACGPDKLNLSMTEDEMGRYVEQAHECGIRSINFTGGEPTLVDFDLPMALAYSYGMCIDVRTNASWARNPRVAHQRLEQWKLQGLTRLGLSYDTYHSAVIPPHYVTHALEAARDLCIPTYLDWIGLESKNYVTKLLGLTDSELRYVGPPLKVGAATRLEHEHFEYLYTRDLMCNSKCRSEMLLTIFPGGHASLHPCCWVNPSLIRRLDDIRSLKKEMESSPMANFLLEKGVAGLITKAQELCMPIKPYYSRHCEACYDLLGLVFPNEVSELPQYIQEFAGVEVKGL